MMNEVWTVVDIIHNDEEYKKSTLDQRLSVLRRSSTWGNEVDSPVVYNNNKEQKSLAA